MFTANNSKSEMK